MTYVRPVNLIHNKQNWVYIRYPGYISREMYALRFPDITNGYYWAKAQKTYINWCECPGNRDPQVPRKFPKHWSKTNFPF